MTQRVLLEIIRPSSTDHEMYAGYRIVLYAHIEGNSAVRFEVTNRSDDGTEMGESWYNHLTDAMAAYNRFCLSARYNLDMKQQAKKQVYFASKAKRKDETK